MRLRLTFCGAAQTVTGSCFLLETAGGKVLIDCGMFQGGKERERNSEPFPFEPGEIQAVLLTHAHVDHSGLLPRLVRQGFRGRIAATEATADLCAVMLPDAAHIQEMEAEWRSKKARRAGREPVEPLYTPADAQKTLDLLFPVKYGQEVDLLPGLRFRMLDAGHILGSAIVEVWVEENGRRVKLVFTGDLGQRNAPIIRDPTRIDETDYLVIESTYGDRLHEGLQDRRQELAAVVKAAIKSGGNLVIPAFAVERTQALLYDLKSLMDAGEIPQINVYIDSPMAVSATEIFRRHPDCYDAETKAMLAGAGSPFEFPTLTYVREVAESQALNRIKGGAVIVSASGMCEAGRILHHLKHNLWRPESHLLFVGYQAKGTLGRRLLDGEKLVRVMGEEIVVRASVHNIGGYSAHADRDDLLEWLGAIKKRPRGIFLVHGEAEAMAVWRETVQRTVGAPTFVPAYGEGFELEERARPVGVRAVAGAVEDEWSRMVRELDAAYHDLRSRMPGRVPADPASARRLRKIIRRILDDMAKVG